MDSNDKLYSVLGYFGILFLIPILAGKTEFTRFHGNQGLVLFIADAISGVAAAIISTILGFIPVIGWILAPLVSGAIGILLLVLMIMGIVGAVQGEMKPLPIIGGIKIIK